MNKIQRLSAIFKFIFIGLFILYPLLVIAFWVMPETYIAGIARGIGFSFIPADTVIMHQLSWLDKFMGFAVDLVPNLLVMTAIYCLIKLFALYEQGKFFVVASARYLRRVGFLLLISDLTAICIFHPLMQIVMTKHNPIGHRYTSVSFSTHDIYNILIALLIILISWIMLEACKIYEEQELTV